MLNRYLLIISLLIVKSAYSSHHPEAFVNNIRGKSNEGHLIIQHFCLDCHAENPLIPVGAPPKGDAAAWKLRLQQGFPMLFKHTAEGINAMPARGGCFECSDEQLILAIAALLPKETQKDFISSMKAHK